jgi:DNA invertase Pin-like site-specific DNA recombinase
MTIERGHLITPEHLGREAIVYIRQSGMSQVLRNCESTRVQRDLREKAIELGWRNPELIHDLGISAGGFDERPGFQTILGRVVLRQVGIILAFDASRLSRNCKDWAHLFQLCQHFGTLIADADQVYDLTSPNDRLVMGIKGTLSEVELDTIQQRLRSGLEAKAARGDLKIHLATGYDYDSDDKVVFDPDKRVRIAIEAMFAQFDRVTSVRQLAMWYRHTETRFPSRPLGGIRRTRWEIPTANTLHKLLAHALYAGAYVFGRRSTVVDFEDGKIVKRRVGPVPVEQARVCIRDHHPAYITWGQFLANRSKIEENRPRWNMQQNRGAIRDGLALLTGMLRCGRCGANMHVKYRKNQASYYCDGGDGRGSGRCNFFGSKLIGERVSEELCCALETHAIQTAIQAAEMNESQRARETESARMQVEAAQLQADRAFEQFDLCDPKNRHVVDTLEERLNDKIADLRAAEDRCQRITEAEAAITDETRSRLLALGDDFPAVWNHPDADARLKKRILRAAIHEVLVEPIDAENRLQVTIHWRGGTHTQLQLEKPKRPSRVRRVPSLRKLVRELAAEVSDTEITRILVLKKLKTPDGLRWTKDRVRDYREQQQIESSPREHSDSMTMRQVQDYLAISHNAVQALARRGALTIRQITDFAPWRVPREQVESREVRRLVAGLKKTGRLPRGDPQNGQPGLFDANKGLTSETQQGAL